MYTDTNNVNGFSHLKWFRLYTESDENQTIPI